MRTGVRVLSAAVAAAAVLFLVNVVAGPFVSLATKSWPEEIRGSRVIGATQGPIKRKDPDSTTVRVASGFLGLVSLPVVVTPLTRIAVGGKLGGFADLDRGQLVRVSYEVLPDRLVASRIDVLDRSGAEVPVATPAPAIAPVSEASAQERPAGTSPRSMAAPSPVAPPPSPVPQWTSVPMPKAEPAPAAAVMPAPADRLPPLKRAPIQPPSSRSVVSAPSTTAPANVAVQAAPAPARAPAPAATARPPAPRTDARAPSAPATRPGSEDGTAAVDWLLKQP